MNNSNLETLISKGYIRKSVCGDLVLYNYTEKTTHKKEWNQHTLNARGHIYERKTHILIARPFPKFFNFDEHSLSEQTKLLKHRSYQVYEKKDGSLGIIYFYKGKWRVNTRGSFKSKQAIKAMQMLSHYDLSDVDTGLTLLVEIIYPENRIIIDYGAKEELVLLGANVTAKDHELEWNQLKDLANKTKMTLPKVYTFKSLIDVIAKTKKLPATEEGYVVRLNNGYRFKVKSEEYLKMVKLKTGLTRKVFCQSMRAGKINTELVESIPEELESELLPIIKSLEEQYQTIEKEIMLNFKKLNVKNAKEIKTALKAIEVDSKDSAPYYKLFRGADIKDPKIEKYIMRQIKKE